MRSEATFGRLAKLWVSLWTLVLEGKRHLETVTALLQRIVFEERGYPRFKNWPEICKLGKKDHLLMTVLATVDLSIRHEAMERLIAAFPECFSYQEIAGPYPLSLMRAEGHRVGATRENHHGEDFPVCFDGVPKHIPLTVFDRSRTGAGDQLPEVVGPLPDHVRRDEPQGSIFSWEGRSFVVLEKQRLHA